MVKMKTRVSVVHKEMLFDFVLGFILCKATMFFNILPFSISYSVAVYNKKQNISAALGSFLGYLFLANSDVGYKYAGALLIIIAIMNLTKINIFFLVPSVMLLCSIITGINTAFTYTFVINTIIDITVCTCATYFYGIALKNDNSDKKFFISVIISMISIISSLSYITFFNISPVRIASVFVILLITYFANGWVGATIGILFGICIDSSISTMSSMFALGYSFPAIISSGLSRMNKTLFCSAYIIMYSVASVFNASSPLFLISFFEILIACLCFLIIPSKKASMIYNYFSFNTEKEFKNFAKARSFENVAKKTTDVLNELSHAIGTSIDTDFYITYDDIKGIYNIASNEICTNCSLSQNCWNKDYLGSVDALNTASKEIISRGYCLSTDFPSYFSSKCINFSEYIEKINQGLSILKNTERSNLKIEENKQIISRQYKALSNIFKDISYSIKEPIEVFPSAENKILNFARMYGSFSKVSVYSDVGGQTFVEIYGDDINNISDVRRFTHEISKFANTKLKFHSQICSSDEYITVFKQTLKYSLDICSKTAAKKSDNGDILTTFNTDDGISYTLLSDGMGSGKLARKESVQAINLLKSLLKSGVSATKALNALAPIITFKTNSKNFVALDMLSIDLNTLEGFIAKYGASASFIVRDGKILKITSKNMPLGLCDKAEISRVRLKKNDLVVMMSDGIEANVGEILQNCSNPEEICNKMMNASKVNDDKTIVCIKINLHNL